MGKYIDMEVLSDLKIDHLDQTELILNPDGITLHPVMEGVDLSGEHPVGFKLDPSTSSLKVSDGSAWVDVVDEVSLPDTQVIQITASDLDSGIATIQHNLGKVPFGLSWSVTPKDIVYVDENTLKLDFSDQATDFAGATVWFIGSQQSMLVAPTTNTEG